MKSFNSIEDLLLNLAEILGYFGIAIGLLEAISRIVLPTERDWVIGLTMYLILSALFVAWSASFFHKDQKKSILLLIFIMWFFSLIGLAIAFFYHTLTGVFITSTGIIGLILVTRVKNRQPPFV